MKKLTRDEFTLRNSLTFIIPSLIGIILFMIPIKFNNEITIPVALMSKFLANALEGYLTAIITLFICISALLCIITKVFKPKFIVENEFLNTLFNISPIWFVIRILGPILYFCII